MPCCSTTFSSTKSFSFPFFLSDSFKIQGIVAASRWMNRMKGMSLQIHVVLSCFILLMFVCWDGFPLPFHPYMPCVAVPAVILFLQWNANNFDADSVTTPFLLFLFDRLSRCLLLFSAISSSLVICLTFESCFVVVLTCHAMLCRSVYETDKDGSQEYNVRF